MNQAVLNEVVEKTHALISAPSCCDEAKAAAQAWLDAIGTDQEAAQTKKYVDELEADIIPIDGLIAFAQSDSAIEVFGAKTAQNIETHAKELKAAGAVYCDCPACAAVEEILKKKDLLLQ